MRVSLIVLALLAVSSGSYLGGRGSNIFMKMRPGQISISEAEIGRSGFGRGQRQEIRDSDIVLTRRQYNYLFKENKNRTGFKAEIDERRRWTGGVVPYVIDQSHFDEEQTRELHTAMETLERFTCLQFREKREDDENWIKYTDNESGCNSQLGMMGWGKQAVNLGVGCKWRGLYLHEIGHALGLIHEHQRPDRDDHVKIIWRRVKSDYLDAFTTYKNEAVTDFGIEYDYSSIMHYEPEAFNDDQELTTVPHDEWQVELMFRVYYKTLSFTDTRVLNEMYKCGDRCRNSCPPKAYLNKDCQCITPKDIHEALCVNELPDRECYEKVRAGDCTAEWAAAEMHIKCRKACGSCPTYGMDEYIQPLTRPYDDCVDRYHEPERCETWAAAGDCDRFPHWMKRNCRRSCDACDWEKGRCRNYYKGSVNNEECDGLAREGRCTADHPLVMAGCQDSCQSCGYQLPGDCGDDFEGCETAARAGECDARDPQTAAQRQRYCRKSCNSCFLGRGNCRDELGRRECRLAASQGKCRTEPAVYKLKCRSSCDSCQFGMIDDSCEDIHPAQVCRSYAKHGTCEENKGYAYRFCASSCSTCDFARDPPCEDFHPSCEQWAATGECTSNHQSMSTSCAKTCGTCDRYAYGSCANVDHDAFCEIQREGGGCERYRTQMKRDCRRSCGHCEAPPIEKFWECKDLLPKDCRYWKGLGECETNPLALKAFCHLTCGHCTK